MSNCIKVLNEVILPENVFDLKKLRGIAAAPDEDRLHRLVVPGRGAPSEGR